MPSWQGTSEQLLVLCGCMKTQKEEVVFPTMQKYLNLRTYSTWRLLETNSELYILQLPKTWTSLVLQLYLVLIQSLESLWFLSLNCVLLNHNPSHPSWDEWELLLLQIEWTLLYLWHPSNTALVILLLNSAPLLRSLRPNFYGISLTYLGKKK